MKATEVLKDTPRTTAAGGILGFGGIVLSLLPSEVRDACLSAVNESGNPVIVSALVSAGLVLTIIGPSLAARKKSDQSE